MPFYHIHIDASWVSADFERFLTRKLGFVRTDFVSADGGKIEPLNHLTLKLHKASDFRSAFDQVVAFVEGQDAMGGYVEGEVISMDSEIPFKPFNPNVPLPFKLDMGVLPHGLFRESEVHITLCPDRSDPRLLRTLSDMGFLSIYMPKPQGIALVYTAQGTRSLISSISIKAKAFLDSTGGAVACSIKEERIARWWVSDNSVVLPPVVEYCVD